MNKNLEKKLNNILRTEAQRTMQYETDKNIIAEKMNDIFNLKKILDNYDELEPILIEFFNNKTMKDKYKYREE